MLKRKKNLWWYFNYLSEWKF